MTFSRLILTCALTAMLATPALARHGDDDDDDSRRHDIHHGSRASEDDNRHCTSAPGASWLSIAEIEARARKLGYAVTKVERDRACYEVYASKDGQSYELYFDPVTGTLVKLERDR